MLTSLASRKARTPRSPQPITVRLTDVTASGAVVSPPDHGDHQWYGRLKVAMGTSSPDFLDASMRQLQMACRLPMGGICETSLNAALALIEAGKPKDEIEGALCIQMAATHAASMAVLSRLGNGHGSDQRVATMASAASRLLRAFTSQVEALRRLRGGSCQLIRVERVEVQSGAQAIIGIANTEPRPT